MARRSREERASELRRLPGSRGGGQVRNRGQMPGPKRPKFRGGRALPGRSRPSTGTRLRKRGQKDESLTLGTATVDRSEQGAAQPLGAGSRLGLSAGPPPAGKPAGGPRGASPTPPDRGVAKQVQKRALPGKAGQAEQELPESEFAPLAAGRTMPGGDREGAVFEIARNPSADEMTRSAPVGRIQTPDYSVEKGKDGKFKNLQMTEAGKIKVEEYKQKEIQKMGTFPGYDDPNSPKPQIEPGQPFFNPYNGTWTEPEGIKSESVMDKYGS